MSGTTCRSNGVQKLRAGVRYFTLRQAAALLTMTEEALQTRCRREARRVGRDTVARLGDGVTAVKFGKLWRIRFGDIPSDRSAQSVAQGRTP